MRQVEFLVVDYPSTYNVILGRPTLNRLIRAATSTYYLKVKFPTPHGIGEICGDQTPSKGMLSCSPSSKENHAWMVAEDLETIYKETKTVEEALNVELVEGDPLKATKIGRELQLPLKEEIINFLRGNKDVFAWSDEDMPGINKRVIKHRLNVDPTKKPV